MSILCLMWVHFVSVADAAVKVIDLDGERFQVEFRYTAPPGTQTVYLAGSFNGWNPKGELMRGPDESGVFSADVTLPKGRHEYKFVINGERWEADPDNPHRTEGYGNAVVFVGILPENDGATAPTAPAAVAKAKPAAHPEAIEKLAELLTSVGAAERGAVLDEWFAGHPMPLFSAEAVSFVYADTGASAVKLGVDAYGARHEYELGSLAPGVYAISLERSALTDRMGYRYVVTTAEGARWLLDPHGWSVTSRGNQPVSWLVEAAPERGRLEVLADVHASGETVRSRDVYVYLPPGYDAGAEAGYPVLYMHDGQNCWDDPVEPFGHGGWCVNREADRLIGEERIAPFIAVGVANTPDRMVEYGPGPDILDRDRQRYLRFLVGDVKPLIDRRYRTRPEARHTALMGSSMGGVVSLQGALLYPEVFGQAACLSSALQFRDAKDQGYEDLVRARGKQPVRLYLDSGTAGAGRDGVAWTRAMAGTLRELGWKDGDDLLHFEDEGAEHNERAWRARVHRPLEFLFGR